MELQVSTLSQYTTHSITPFSGKFSLKNTVTAIFAGLGLLTFVTMVCDLILLNYTSEKLEVAEILKEF